MQFKEAMSVLSSFLGAGYSTENAISAAIPELIPLFGEKSMIVQEFRYIKEGFSMNRPLGASLGELAERSGLWDIQSFTEIYLVAKRSGGQLVPILRQTSQVIRDKLSISEDILTMHAAKRYEQNVMNLIPFLLILYMNLTSPDFFSILYTTLLGRIVMTLCLGLYLFARQLSERILSIEV